MKTKSFIHFLFTPLFAILIQGCLSDEYDLNFTSQNDFNLNSSSHELLVTTQQDEPVFSEIVINNKFYYILLESIDERESFSKDFENFNVLYTKSNPAEINGEWFTIKRKDKYSILISLKENNENKGRAISLKLSWRSAENDISIRQAGKYN